MNEALVVEGNFQFVVVVWQAIGLGALQVARVRRRAGTFRGFRGGVGEVSLPARRSGATGRNEEDGDDFEHFCIS